MAAQEGEIGERMKKKRMELVSLKGYPEMIRPTLEATFLFGSNSKRFRAYLVQYAEEKLGSNAQEENLVSNQAIPMCRKLGFISGELGHLHLEDSGRVLLAAYREGGDSLFKRRLFDALLKADNDGRFILRDGDPNTSFFHILFQIVDSSRKVTNASLLKALEKRSIDASKDRLSKFLRVLSYVDLVRRGGGVVELNTSQSDYEQIIDRSLFKTPSQKKLIDALHNAYFVLSNNRYGEPVEIPPLRDIVCLELEVGSEAFNSMLRSIPPDVYDRDVYEGELVHFSSALFGRVGGIWRGGKYYFYMVITQRRKKD